MEFVQARRPEKRGRKVVAVVKNSEVNQMNPPNFDKIGVTAMLISLNESPVLVNLKERSSVVDDLRRASWPAGMELGSQGSCQSQLIVHDTYQKGDEGMREDEP
ncbi:myosin-6-like isoform X3 [Lethenteron reissneri]|uniref:myosin-6-like isoform X3 n=1 Tax=Lethenteron reissneri TaxID=7753 RepID=UPI002AB66BA9|nr:myosin-6-like isoform X3 [Lethenteron reissneri]XP_061404382.1 myosin-6-like isoform X3 [Lethenteron reissneri]